MSTFGKIMLFILFILVLLSLGLNGFLIWQWLSFQGQIYALGQTTQDFLSQAIVELDSLQDTTLEFEFQVNQRIPIQSEVPFNQTFQVPIQTTIPISQNIKTNVVVNVPDFGINLPLEVEVPIDMEVPLDLEVPVQVDQSVPISTTVPISLDVPIAIDVGETELAGYLERLRATLESIQGTLSNMEQRRLP